MLTYPQHGIDCAQLVLMSPNFSTIRQDRKTSDVEVETRNPRQSDIGQFEFLRGY